MTYLPEPRPNVRVLCLLGIAFLGCRPASGWRAPADSEARATDAGASAVARLAEVEDRRIGAGIGDDDVGNHDVSVRRQAARALARIAGAQSTPLLFKALSDEDAETVAWAAYGLGYLCRTEGPGDGDIVRALVTRAAAAPTAQGAALDPQFAIARALGRCASEEAEKTLEAWLSGPRPRASYAALALGDIASKRKSLAAPTQLSLLDAAASGFSGPPLAEGLYPFGRLEHPLASATERLLEVATARLADAGPARVFAVRALSRSTHGAVAELSRVLSNVETFNAAERVEAARGLGRLGDAGQRALADALPSLVPARDPVSMTALGTSAFGPLLVALETLSKLESAGTKRVLYELAGLGVPPEAPPTLVRRVVKVRCRAAALLVNGAAEDPLLVRCDPDEHGETGERAALEVLGRRRIQHRRLALFRALLGSTHLRIREAAIELLGAHPEVDDTPAAIAAALSAKEAGLVSTAAQFVVSHPDRLGGGRADVVGKVDQALNRTWADDDVETLGLLIEAAGVVHLDAALPKLEAYCRHANPTLRGHAARALSLLKSSTVICSAVAEPAKAAPELGHLVTGDVKLVLDTDAGPLAMTLDPSAAPVAVTRFADLAREGFYNRIVFHRVVPGFVVQFGDPGGDGFGGSGRDSLRCETTPAPFEPLTVGVALAGRDTGSSQLFVTLARHPHLDEEFAIVGRASGDWNAVAEGDVIREVTIAP